MTIFSGWKALVFMAGGLIAFGLYLYFFVGIDELVFAAQKINTANYLFFFSLAIVSMLLALLCWATAWRTVLRTLKVNLSIKKTFMIFMVGYFLDLVIPSETIGSEVTRLYLVRNETRGDLGAIAASAVTNRIVEYSIVAVGLCGSIITLVSSNTVPSVVSGFMSLVLVGVLIYLAILLLLALNEHAAQLVVKAGFKLLRLLRIKKYQSANEDKTKTSLAIFYNGFGTFRQTPKKLLLPLVFQLLSFMFNIAVYVLVLQALGIQNLNLGFFILVFFIASAIQGATASLSVGSLDIILVTVFTLYGITAATSGIAVILLRTVTYWFPLLASYVTLQVYGVRNLLSARSAEEATSASPQN